MLTLNELEGFHEWVSQRVTELIADGKMFKEANQLAGREWNEQEPEIELHELD